MIENTTPRPIEDGQVPQIVVRYLGRKGGDARYRPPSGKTYSFGAGESNDRKYVLLQDVDYFRRFADFEVLPETLIDPAAERQAAIQKGSEELERRLADLEARKEGRTDVPSGHGGRPGPNASSASASLKKRGRPAGQGIGALVDCWMHCCGSTDGFDSVRDAYDAVYAFLEISADFRELPTRARLPKLRSEAKLRREKLGRCVYHQHRQAIIPAR